MHNIYSPQVLLLLQTEIEDAVYIWSAEGGSSQASGAFTLESLVPLEDTAASISWLDSAGLPPLLAVGYASGLLEVFARQHRCGQGDGAVPDGVV